MGWDPTTRHSDIRLSLSPQAASTLTHLHPELSFCPVFRYAKKDLHVKDARYREIEERKKREGKTVGKKGRIGKQDYDRRSTAGKVEEGGRRKRPSLRTVYALRINIVHVVWCV